MYVLFIITNIKSSSIACNLSMYVAVAVFNSAILLRNQYRSIDERLQLPWLGELKSDNNWDDSSWNRNALSYIYIWHKIVLRVSNAERYVLFYVSLKMLLKSRWAVIYDAMTLKWPPCNVKLFII